MLPFFIIIFPHIYLVLGFIYIFVIHNLITMRKLILPLLCAFFLTCICVCSCCGQTWTLIDDEEYISTCIAYDNQGNRFMTFQQGHLKMNDDTLITLPTWFLNEQGLVACLPHNGYVYLHLSGLDTIQRVIRMDIETLSLDTIIEVSYVEPGFVPPFSSNHRGGQIVIADSIMYSSFGYGKDQYNSQDSSDFRGKIIATNLNTNESWIHAYGLRNPYRIEYDELYDRLWVADVGSTIAEEVNICYGGENFGWPNFEADSCRLDCSAPNTLPIYWYVQEQPRYIIGGKIFNHRYYFSDGGSGKGGRIDSLGNYTPLNYPKDLTSMSIDSFGRLVACDWIGHIFQYEELPLAIDSIEEDTYEKPDYYDWWLEELISRYGDVYFDVQGRAYLDSPTNIGYYYSVVRKQWKFIAE
jgi:hypothetical protein